MNSEIDLIALWAAQIGRRHTSAQSGKTAYEYAVEGGYTGSEEEFAQKLASLMNGSMIGYVNERNEITVTGALAAGAYTVFYEMKDGTLVRIGELTVAEEEPVPEPATYTVTFMADGVTVAEVTYTEGETSVNQPAVPPKEGYTGVWEAYTLQNADVTVHAVYTATEPDPSPTNYADPSDPLWQVDQRLATSYGYGKSCAGHILTNFVPAQMGDVIYVTGLDITGTASSYGGSVSAFKGLPADSSNTAVQNVYQSAFAYTGIHESHDHAAKSCVTGEGDAYVYTILMGEDGQNRANTETTHIRIDGIPVSGYKTSADDTANTKDIVINVRRDGTWL